MIVIAHRYSTLNICSKIFVIKEGTIWESGSHHELKEKKGEYYSLLEF